MEKNETNFGEMLRRRRVMIPFTLQQLSDRTGVSPSHLGRIEKGKRFPSARVLKKIANPLGFDENELFGLAGFLTHPYAVAEKQADYKENLDPYVATALGQEPVEVQRGVLAILALLKTLAKESGKKAAADRSS